MSELPGGVEPAAVPEPRESALAIVARIARGGRLEILFGRRSRASRFLPGHLAFPGGRLETSDRPGEPGAHLRCAVRELEEETGLGPDPGAWTDAGVRVTPPLFPVRFRTVFFVVPAPDGFEVEASPSNPENEWLGFLEPGAVLERWAAGREALPPPVVAVLRAVAGGAPPDGLDALARRIRVANEAEERAPRIEFVPDVWTFPVKTRTLPPATHTNVWLPGGGRFVVIDPGSEDAAERAALDRVVDRRIAEGAAPQAVVLTHHHQDHVSGAAFLAMRLGVPVAAHPEVLRRVRLDATPTRAIEADETIDLDGIRLRAVLTEGHAPGHLAFHVPERDALISGDLVSALSTMLIDPDGGDMDAYLDSLRRAEELRPRVVFPAHGPPVPARALARVRAHREARETRIVEALGRGGAALADLARAAYADTPGAVAFLAERQTLAHLVRLERAGRAERIGDRWRASSAV